MRLFLCFVCFTVGFQRINCRVFREGKGALQLLRSSSRWRRANALLLEEVLPGNLERECYEEVCSEEEASEIFRTREKTMEFWFRYKNVPRCRFNPCQNGGFCSEQHEHVHCLCPPGFTGPHCASEVRQCSLRNGGCEQYCSELPGGAGVQCGCAFGYRLDQDGLGCSRTGLFPCGRQQNPDWVWSRSLSDRDLNWTLDQNKTVFAGLESRVRRFSPDALWAVPSPDAHQGAGLSPEPHQGAEQGDGRIVGGDLEEEGGSPWTVLIRRKDGFGFCGGTLVSERWVVSAAHCFHGNQAHHVTIGDLDKLRLDRAEQTAAVEKTLVHPHFHDFTFDSDVALVLLKTPVKLGPTAIPACVPDRTLSEALLRENMVGVVSGWGTTHYMGRSSRFLRKVALPVVKQRTCRLSTDQVVTDNMFCAGFVDVARDSCGGDSGGPFVVHFRGAWFLTGVVSWGEQCATRGKYGVYTRLGQFLNWIRDTMEQEEGPDRDQQHAENQTRT